MRLSLVNEPEPDAFLIIDPARGGQTKIDDGGYIVAGPELIVEVTASSASYDLHLKKQVYRRHDVREYVVWRTYDAEIDWFVLRHDKYERLLRQL